MTEPLGDRMSSGHWPILAHTPTVRLPRHSSHSQVSATLGNTDRSPGYLNDLTGIRGVIRCCIAVECNLMRPRSWLDTA
jgi:hypothetical protein